MSRNVEDLLADCVDVIESNFYGAQAETDGEYNALASKIETLAAELALCPDTYYAISELFTAANTRQEDAERAEYNRDQQLIEEGDDVFVDVSDDAEQQEGEFISEFDKEGLFAGMDDPVSQSSLNLSSDIAKYLGRNLT